MERIKSLIIIGILVAVFAGCQGVRLPVVTDYDREADFSTYQTYYWSDNFQHENGSDEPLFYNTLIKKRLKSAIQSEMEGRGYELDPENPDLLVDSRVIVEKSSSQNYYPASPYYYWGYYPYSQYQSTSQRKEGGIIVELIDKDRRQLIWQGYAPDVLHAQKQDKQEEIRNAISMIFSEYDHRANP